MKKRMLGLLTALALCLSLLPGTALAEETGAVTITGPAEGAQPVTLEAEKYYVINTSTSGGGVTVQETAPTGKSYLTYADGVLTVCGEENNEYSIEIFGKMALSADLKMVLDSNAQASSSLRLSWNGNSGPALSLDGHTLTLGKDMGFKVQSGGQPAVDGGTVRFTEWSRDNEIVFQSTNANAASGDLTVENAELVNIGGQPPVFEHLTVENCGKVIIGGQDLAASDAAQKITSSVPLILMVNSPTQLIMMPDHTVWAIGGGLGYGTHFIESNVTTPTAYRAGEGWALYTPGDDDTGAPAKLTLDGASYNGTINIQQAKSVQLELKGENAVESVNAKTMTLTGNGSFQGTLETQDFTNNSTATLNAVVKVTVPEEGTAGSSFIGQTVYGNRKTSDINVSGVEVLETAALTIAAGAALTVDDTAPLGIYDFGNLTNKGTIVNEGTIQILLTEEPQGTPDFGTVVNNGEVKIYPTVDINGEKMSAFIKGLGLTGTGTVTVEKTVSGSGPVTETYTNSGLKLLEPAGDGDGKLDLRDAGSADTTHWEDQGYKWEVLETDPDNTSTITKAKLTLAPGFNAEKVVLPDATVEIETKGESTIGTLSPYYLASPDNTHADKTKLTLSGEGPLTVRELINISGGNENTLTVARDAVVVAAGGVSVGASGSVDGLVTVNGTLITENSGGGAALSSGNVVVGGSGTLKVSGTTGVSLAGKSDPDFHGAFTIQPGGRLEADCTGNAVEVTTGSSSVTFNGYEAGDILVFPSGYLPQDRQPRFNEDKTSLSIPGGRAFNISSDNVPTPPTPSHRHKWAEDWTTSATHHWHACTASGCPVTKDSEKDGYAEHAYSGSWDAVCDVCGYVRTLPDREPSEPSGGGHSGGGGASRPTSPITVEPSAHGTVTPDRSGAVYSAPVTLTVQPDSGYGLESLTVTNGQGIQMMLSDLGNGKYAFTMPAGAVTVRAAFTALEEKACPSRAFSDLDVNAWYHEATDFVLDEGLMNGYSGGTFRPDGLLSRAQLAQILYNRAGRPSAAGGAAFSDTAPGAWYAPAVAWAAERGIVGGYADGTFRPDGSITREQLAVMLWRHAGSPASSGQDLDFTDAGRAGDYAREALRWAVESGVMSGKSGGVLDPQGLATRAQAAQMLKNYLKNS